LIYGALAKSRPRVSRLVLGIDHQVDSDAIERQCESYLAAGGNAFDTAWHYEAWRERSLGQFLERHRLFRHVTIIVKGAHTPYCTPEHLDQQLAQSLEHLRTERADVFLIHRDNPDVPVGEFVDCLNRHREAGRIELFGGSNWGEERFQAANRYAVANGLRPMSCVSNQFSLVSMEQPLWPGALASSSPEARTWHHRTQLPLLAYTPLARGFLSESSKTGARAEEISSSFGFSHNHERRERARELARRRGVSLVDIALAYVLCQSFPTFVVIGPRHHQQLASSFPSLKLRLERQELRWLERGDQA
jgi:aryl-alcohol dehydrogenase-like predicted oxidoreductase